MVFMRDICTSQYRVNEGVKAKQHLQQGRGRGGRGSRDNPLRGTGIVLRHKISIRGLCFWDIMFFIKIIFSLRETYRYSFYR